MQSFIRNWNIYHTDIPDFILALSKTAPMQRLKQVGMNCGCEYTRFPAFQNLQSYSRFDHSVGAGLIVWHFTHDRQQSVAALLHDIATPVFAHVIDFLHHDYTKQESTEDKTLEIIAQSFEIRTLLSAMNLTPEDVADYHIFPIADNDTPRLSADRLEYTMGNILNYGFADASTIQVMYDNLFVGTNEDGKPELSFKDFNIALQFAHLALKCSHVYVSDEDRFAMQMLAELLQRAIADHIIAESDLMKTEPEVIVLLTGNIHYKKQWQQFCAYSHIEVIEQPCEGSRRIAAKKRHINPLVSQRGRVASIDNGFNQALQQFLSQTFDRNLIGFTE